MPRDEVLAASEMQVIVRERMEIPAPEDITIDHAAGVAFVSSQRRRDEKTGKILTRPEDQPGGAIVALDLRGEQVTKRLLMDQDALGFPFHPHGLSLFCGTNGERRLLVINHRGSDDHAVEAFDVEGGRLRHAGTVRDREHLIGPNDLVALDGDRFYVTNDHGTRRALLQLLESGAALPWSTVVFYDGGRFHTVAKRIEMANGIALDHARRRLYVAAFRSKRIYDYAWDAGDPARELIDPAVIDLPGCPDNLEWDEDGNLWIGADPSFVKVLLYFFFEHLMPTAPSLVLCLRFDGGNQPRVESVFRDETGDTISASSVAAVHGRGTVRRLLIGVPIDNHLLDCELRGAY
ncbi:MAG TPA: SMP-30/gluconolactonase/LRE family protein [Isosphaeraceae bacterium]|nr:SMP-30/gluconolactonase/LRE family protein [Isosphaeraceae bacterium]